MRDTIFRAISYSFFLIAHLSGINYPLTSEPIDVVIPAVEKDLFTLEYAIAGIKKFGKDVRRVIVVSKNHLTDNAEWYDETLYPFSLKQVSQQLYHQDNHERAGWYFQQLLKFYAPFIIPGISSNVLILDSDVIFLKPVTFLNEQNGGLYPLAKEFTRPYFNHAALLVPEFEKQFRGSGVAHHMLFQRPVLEDLFAKVESRHRQPFWKAFCSCVRPGAVCGASEYEIYFNFVFQNTSQVMLRPLSYDNVTVFDFDSVAKTDWDFVTCHSWSRTSP